MADVVIKVRKGGPYKVTGPVVLTDFEGNEIEVPDDQREAMVLCRCGQSSTKPFCDSTHKRVEFDR